MDGNNSDKKKRKREDRKEDDDLLRRPDPPSNAESPSEALRSGQGEAPDTALMSRARAQLLMSHQQSQSSAVAGISSPLAGLFPASDFQQRQQQMAQLGGVPPHLLGTAYGHGGVAAGGVGGGHPMNLQLLQYLAATNQLPGYGSFATQLPGGALLQGQPYHHSPPPFARHYVMGQQQAQLRGGNPPFSTNHQASSAARDPEPMGPHTNSSSSNREDNQRPKPTLTHRKPVPLYVATDDDNISEYQSLARKQIEVFEARDVDISAGAQGRNRPITLGQVGIRCVHCSRTPHRQKAKGSTYYPSKLNGIYQAAQNISNTHLCKDCHAVSQEIRDDLMRLQAKKSGPGGGKKYWSDAARSLGIYEDEINGLRFSPSTAE